MKLLIILISILAAINLSIFQYLLANLWLKFVMQRVNVSREKCLFFLYFTIEYVCSHTRVLANVTIIFCAIGQIPENVAMERQL